MISRAWRKLLVASIAFSLLPGAVAVAQTRSKARPSKPAPAAKVDAAPPEETPAAPASGETATATATSEPVPAPPPSPSELEAGVRASPLNPQPPELPSNAADAGVPVDYDRLLADIAALRARVAAVADNLYQSRIAIALQLDNDRARVGKLTVALDDGIVYTAPPSFAAADMTPVYEHAVAPGRHAVTVDVERRDARDEAFRTSQRTRFSVDVPRDHRLEVQVKLIDDSGMGGDFPSGKSGKYDLRFRVKAVAKPVRKR